MSELKFVVAVDGSHNSREAFEITTREFLGPEDHITILHFFSDEKVYLPYNFKREYIYDDYENYLISFYSSRKYSLDFVPRDTKIKTAEQIQQYAETNSGGLLVVGFSGAKGPKEDPTLMSSAVDHNVKFGKVPFCIVKKNFSREELGGFHWLVLVDGSEQSLRALEMTFRLLDTARDQVTLLHAYNVSHVDYREIYMPMIYERGVRGTFEEFACGVNIAKELVDYINSWETDFHFIVMGVSGMGTSNRSSIFNVGSVTQNVLKYAKTNIIINK